MRQHAIDLVARMLGNRSTRRTAIAGWAAGLAVAASTRALLPVGGADATPARAGGAGADPEFLFVQTFQAGSWAPKPGDEGTYLLTLSGRAAQTVYFSDRPERIVGTVPTLRFLEALGFTPANPPNAALVAETDAGEDILVVELFSPVYGEDFGPDGGLTLTYEARVLADYADAGLAHLAARQQDGALPSTFGPASLFIDDCADASVECVFRGGGVDAFVGSIGPIGYCWHWSEFCCQPCQSTDGSYWAAQCNATFAQCDGGCVVTNTCLIG
jgi:hypothetical protein